jgi:hypothetical protein
MKKLTAFVLLAFALVTMTAYAGPYFIIEQNPLAPEAALQAGWDFSAGWLSYDTGETTRYTNFGVLGDFYIENDNVWLYPTPWIAGFDLGFLCGDAFRVDFGMNIITDPTAWPTYIAVDTWTTEITATGYPSSIVTVWGTATFVYDLIKVGGIWTGVWTFTPVIGLECHW